jgi:phosphatidylinositol-3-phosphatase
MGQILTQFHATGHASLDNYITQISGQAPNGETMADCNYYHDVTPGIMGTDGQIVGQGCVYPASAKTLVDQLEERQLTWRGYMEDMGSPCRHPALDEPDTSQTARPGDQYAARHDPFVYFQAISPSSCRTNVVDLDHLQRDLSRVATTRNLTYVTPNLCDDGHDAPCVDGRPGGLASADAWLRTWVPRITSSPAFEEDGVLVVTFDEAEPNLPGGSDACCGEGTSPNTEQAGRNGPGGGRIGAVVLSPFVEPGTRSDVPYNQYSLLRTMEAVFGLPTLGYASTVSSFGDDVWTRG